MSSKRKQILKAIALAGSATMDDLGLSTGIERKNLHDNVKATTRDGLIERIRDDVTGLPAYKLTPKGRKWLEDDKYDDCCVKPQPAVGINTGSKDAGSAVGSGGMCADPLPVGNAIIAPPNPGKNPAAACADVTPHPTWDDLYDQLRAKSKEAMVLRDQICDLECALELANRINNEMANELLEPLGTPAPFRYIIAEDYLIAANEEEAHAAALDLAKEMPIDTPVIVFASHKARELRINWRDA